MLVHSTVYLAPSSRVEPGVVILPKVSLNTNIVIGEGTIIGMESLASYDVAIDFCCHINTETMIHSHYIVNKQPKVDTGEIYLTEFYQ